MAFRFCENCIQKRIVATAVEDAVWKCAVVVHKIVPTTLCNVLKRPRVFKEHVPLINVPKDSEVIFTTIHPVRRYCRGLENIFLHQNAIINRVHPRLKAISISSQRILSFLLVQRLPVSLRNLPAAVDGAGSGHKDTASSISSKNVVLL